MRRVHCLLSFASSNPASESDSPSQPSMPSILGFPGTQERSSLRSTCCLWGGPEIVYYMEVTTPPNTQCCVDVSQSWPERLLIGYGNEVPCLTGSTNLVLLQKDGANTFHLRRILAVELLALQGPLLICFVILKISTSQEADALRTNISDVAAFNLTRLHVSASPSMLSF